MNKIVHVITGLNNGGAEAVLFRLIDHCIGDDNEHIVISMMDYGVYGRKLESIGVTVHCLNLPQGKVTVKAIFKLWKLLKKLKPDVVQTWMYHADLVGGVVARLAGIKNVFWGLHHTNLTNESPISTRLVVRLCSIFSYLVPNKVIACADKSASVHKCLGYKKSIISVAYNGYDMSHFMPITSTLKEELNISFDSFVIGMVGRFNSQKNHENLLKALSHLQVDIPIVCVLVGPDMGEANMQLIEWLEKYKIQDNTYCLGQRDDIANVMNGFDINVLSSSFGEAFPNVLSEAMACGVPCISTDVGDASLIVSDTGWIVPPSNSIALSKAMTSAVEEWVADKKAWELRKQKSRTHVMNNFDISRMVNSYHKVWGID